MFLSDSLATRLTTVTGWIVRFCSSSALKMIAPHRTARGRRADRITQDGRPLRRFKRRWKVERLFAWLYNSRRLVVRYEYHAQNYFGFIQLACIMIYDSAAVF